MIRVIAALALFAAPVAAQQQDNQDFRLECSSNQERSRRSVSYCEMKEFPLGAMGRITVDGRANGGISVKGWSRATMLVRAQIQSQAETDEDARALSGQVRIDVAGGNIRADGPRTEGRLSWSVSYEIFVPHRTDLNLTTVNGGVSVVDITGTTEFRAVNGGVTLKRLAGAVRGRTTNGGLSIELAGNRWDGEELDVQTVNGGVTMNVPSNYSARLETATTNGNITVDFPVTLHGKIDRNLAVDLGMGGPKIRATTTNGGVTIKKS